MKIIRIGEPKIIMSNPYSKHTYFGWPTVARLQNGKIAVTASGFRIRHVCPFGKTVISYSENDGETYTLPAPVIDTVLDDRDGGITAFGESNVIVTSFNNTTESQRGYENPPYITAYLDTVTPEEEQKYLGATFRISNDYGVTFGEIFKSPVSSPHGPAELPDGTLLWVGRTFDPNNRKEADCIQAHKINPDGSTEFVGEIENADMGDIKAECWEPHAVSLDDGTVISHIRVQNSGGDESVLTIFQSESEDGGKTWTKPRQILDKCGGAPSHLYKHSSGMLISTYGYRGGEKGEKPFGVKAMFSRDNGKTWEKGFTLYENNVSADLGYPSTVELKDGSLLTVFYARPSDDKMAVIMQQKWKIEE